MRLIDADALVKIKFHGYPEIEIVPSGVNAEAYKRGWNDAIDAIIECEPSIDAVQVIRCKDCKWYGRVDKRRFYRGMDCLQKRIATIIPNEDFCSRAERKEE